MTILDFRGVSHPVILVPATESTWESDTWESDSTTSESEFESSEESSEEIPPPIWSDSSESNLEPEFEESEIEESETSDSEWWNSEAESTTVSRFDSEMREIPKNLNTKEPKSEAVGERCGFKTCPVGQKCTSSFWGTCE